MYQRAVSRQQRVALLVVEEVRAVLPQALVGVHARAVVAEERLRHERRDLAGGAGDLLDDVLVAEDLVGGLDERPVADVDLGLAGPPTSWCWTSTSMPDACIARTILLRRSWRVSIGGTGK